MDFSKLRISWDAVGTGYTPWDRLKIIINELLHASKPLVSVVYRLTGKVVFNPRMVIKSFTCKGDYGIFIVPAGRAYCQLLSTYEPSVQKLVRSLRSGLFVDVGAEVGLYTVMASKLLGKNGRVIAIEPDPASFGCLKRNVELNGCDNVELWNVAAWKECGEVRLYGRAFGVNELNDSVVPNAVAPSWLAKAMPLDAILGGLLPSMVKMDVEGAEKEVMQGLSSTVSGDAPMKVVFESLDAASLEECWSLLSSHGFAISSLDDGPLGSGNYLAER